MQNFKFYFFALLGLVIFQSCATLFTGTSDKVNIQTQPAGAKIEVNGVPVGTTPSLITLKRSGNAIIVLKKDGYIDKSFAPQKSFNPVSIINLGNILGWVIDAATGSIQQYEQKAYSLDLEKAPVLEKKQNPIP